MSELKHFGVVGMKWGVRRSLEVKGAKASARSSGASKSKRSEMIKEAGSKAAARLYPTIDKAVRDRVVNMSTAKTFAQSYLMGSFGALKYNTARAAGTGRGESAARGLLMGVLNGVSYNGVSALSGVNNRSARKQAGLMSNRQQRKAASLDKKIAATNARNAAAAAKLKLLEAKRGTIGTGS